MSPYSYLNEKEAALRVTSKFRSHATFKVRDSSRTTIFGVGSNSAYETTRQKVG